MKSGRGRKPDPDSISIYAALKEKYPKFGPVQMSMIKNPLYGLQMSAGAISELKAKGISPPAKTRSEKVKKNNTRKKENRIQIRLSDAEKVRLLELKEKSGCKSVQEYLVRLIEKGE